MSRFQTSRLGFQSLRRPVLNSWKYSHKSVHDDHDWSISVTNQLILRKHVDKPFEWILSSTFLLDFGHPLEFWKIASCSQPWIPIGRIIGAESEKRLEPATPHRSEEGDLSGSQKTVNFLTNYLCSLQRYEGDIIFKHFQEMYILTAFRNKHQSPVLSGVGKFMRSQTLDWKHSFLQSKLHYFSWNNNTIVVWKTAQRG